jgi:hypothetical protein
MEDSATLMELKISISLGLLIVTSHPSMAPTQPLKMPMAVNVWLKALATLRKSSPVGFFYVQCLPSHGARR